MYGISIDENGNAYEEGLSGRKKIPSQAALIAKAQAAKARIERAKKAKIASAQRKNRAVAKEAVAKKRASLKRKQEQSFSTFQGMQEAYNEMATSGHMKNLGGMIGNSLQGFEVKGEYERHIGADFGSLNVNSGADFGGFFDTITSYVGGGAKIVGDELENLIKKVVMRRALIEQGDKAFFARMKKLPASTAKTAEITKYTNMVKARDSGSAHKLYLQFANIVVTAMEAMSKEKAQRLQQLFDNPWMVIESKGTIDKALSGYEDGLGVAPLIVGLGVAATASTAAAGYIAGSGNDAKIAQAEIDKNRQLLLDPKVPESVKVEIAKTVASGTQKLSEAALETAKQGGIIGNVSKAIGSATTLVAVAAGAFILVKYVLPMIQQRQAKA